MEAIDFEGFRSQLCGVQAVVAWNRTKLGFSDSRNVLDQTLDSLLHLAVVFYVSFTSCWGSFWRNPDYCTCQIARNSECQTAFIPSSCWVCLQYVALLNCPHQSGDIYLGTLESTLSQNIADHWKQKFSNIKHKTQVAS